MNDVPKGERIAFRSTRGEGRFQKARWSELAVYFDPNAPQGHCYTAELKGCSSHEGEKEFRTGISSASLERALQHFNDSAPSRSVRDQALLWQEKQGHPATIPPGDAFPPAGTYSDAQREAASVALLDEMTTTMDDATDEGAEERRRIVDRVAAALGLQRESARGYASRPFVRQRRRAPAHSLPASRRYRAGCRPRVRPVDDRYRHHRGNRHDRRRGRSPRACRHHLGGHWP
jgi:hypothetical protein